ncbi:glycosyltransferase family 2 protein [Aureimonas pseudogalii]|uniref:Cellulose synthase/poly-beta-1,6-N-acetylglucosamine synthase-like glycosyltransferase n=1 Tax=Aureimonas pseudogalii TaxID=1744844 RepID=A0A7W6H3V7_9HYPH|nr:glycosyltransferase family 2 protein [Aureimonas pseudogalii]MBB3998461.1 cellulose synthase/poly-beta-1,6-N-acetylglucosamine synthase-like glycosyltransferase [Aureimonas pseudogalii]
MGDRLGLGFRELAALRRRARHVGSSLDEEIVACGLASEEEMARAIAAVLGVPTGHIDSDATVLRDPRGEIQIGKRHLRTCDVSLTTRLFMAPPLEALDLVAGHLDADPALHGPVRIVTASEIRAAEAAVTCEERSTRARLSLAMDFNRWSARDVVSPLQAAVGALLTVGIAVAWFRVDHFGFALHVACTVSAFVFTMFRLCVLLSPGAPRPALALASAISDVDAVPRYSVLIALHREAAMAEPLVDAMARLDWPRSKLEVLFVCEASDPDTIAAVERAIAGEPNFSVIATPRTDPTTKPKALNFALPLARGEFLVLYDAEDRPDPRQLRQAFETFRTSSPDLACLQAPLTIRNAEAGWFQSLFAVEYAVLFRAVLPWLARHRLPIPLGGTSNHFRRAALVEAGGWDSHNVAEDADLGIRLARLGYRVGVITAPTSESAVGRWSDWRNQRTRWIKGWLQTWLVHMRAPRHMARDVGWRGFLMFQILFGGMIGASLMHVFFAMQLASSLATLANGGTVSLAHGLIAIADAGNVMLAYLVFLLLANRVLEPEERPLLGRLWSLWFYWLLASYAGIRAMFQLVRTPHLWEKTPHREIVAASPESR